jgi:endonuclease/exonuclease/phosphatase family metal-dependent hydrolase
MHIFYLKRKYISDIMSFTVVSYNIWFQLKLRRVRTVALTDVLRRENPDIICLQEVTSNVLKYIKHILTDHKYIYPPEIDSYGDVILSKYPIVKRETYYYKLSDMGRKLRLTTIDINGKEINIATTHFESEFGEYNLVKRGQFETASKLLSSLDNIILCSDTNISCPEDDDKFNACFYDWIDTWKKHGTVDNQFTYDYITNEYVSQKKQQYRSRLDRILYKGKYLMSQTFNLVDTYEFITPSDHSGIVVKFEFIE